jgi:DNA-binding response OmpR family regulator
VSANAAPPVVLVADDEPTMLELVARHLRTLEHPPMEVIEASDGSEAWRLASERLPDLVVLDVMMPGMSGWEVCRKIRQDAALAHTGVLMLTGIGVSLNETTSPLFGADDYIDKPFDFETLDEKVMAILRRRAVQREAVPRPLASVRARPSATAATRTTIGNGVGGPAKAAAAKTKSAPKASKGPKGQVTKHKKERTAKADHKKGTGITMAAKKKAKKAKKTAKKAAKKGKRK